MFSWPKIMNSFHAALFIGLLSSTALGQDITEQKAPAKSRERSLAPGDHVRPLMVGERKRTYRVHIPKGYDLEQPTPVVLALHGAAMNGARMVEFSELSRKADDAGFIVVYPNGTGVWPFLIWNAGGVFEELVDKGVDDVAFISKLLDDLAGVVRVDEKRVFACGLSNGAMMCYRLAAELSERIAAIAPVAGTVAIDDSQPQRPVPVLHMHGTRDELVPFQSDPGSEQPFAKLRGVEESIQIWLKLDGCDETPKTVLLSQAGEGMKVTRTTYGGGNDGAEVVLVVIEGGGHTWPGVKPPFAFLGKSAMNISANDLIWEFFQKHPLQATRQP